MLSRRFPVVSSTRAPVAARNASVSNRPVRAVWWGSTHTTAGGRDETRRAIVASTAAAAALMCWAPAAGATARFASPEGSGKPCTQPLPCDIVTAVNKAAASDDVTIEPGTYEPDAKFCFDEGHALTIHGLAGAPRPVIIGKSGGFIPRGARNAACATSRWTCRPGSQTALLAVGLGEIVERVLMHTLGSEGVACVRTSRSRSPTACAWRTAPSRPRSCSTPATACRRRCATTRWRRPAGRVSLGSIGVETRAFAGHEVQATLINTIAHGSRVGPAGADSRTNSPAPAMILAEHSNYATQTTEYGTAAKRASRRTAPPPTRPRRRCSPTSAPTTSTSSRAPPRSAPASARRRTGSPTSTGCRASSAASPTSGPTSSSPPPARR